VSSDAAKAQGFFGELFNWSTKSVPMPDGDYTMIAAPDGKTIGGYAPAPAAGSASWLPYLLVASAADAAAKVTKLGGAVHKAPFKVGDFATMAVVADPHGASFAVWQPTKTEDAGTPAVGHFVWNELASKDPGKSVKFYTEIGGFTTSSMDMGPAGSRTGGAIRLGNQPRSPLPSSRSDAIVTLCISDHPGANIWASAALTGHPSEVHSYDRYLR